MRALLALMLLVLVALCLSRCAGCQRPSPPATITVESVVASLTPLARLDTLRIDVSGVVDARGDPAWAIDRPSRLLLIVRGSALYGVPDLERAQVRFEGGRVLVRLPAPVVLESWVDVAASRVWERQEGVLDPAGPALDEAAWREAAAMVARAAASPTHAMAARAQAERLVQELAARVAPARAIRVEWIEGGSAEEAGHPAESSGDPGG